MNRDLQIYRAPENQIPIEDKARLEGYLVGKKDSRKLEHMSSSIKTRKNRGRGGKKFLGTPPVHRGAPKNFPGGISGKNILMIEGLK